jgi:hypothetical protein
MASFRSSLEALKNIVLRRTDYFVGLRVAKLNLCRYFVLRFLEATVAIKRQQSTPKWRVLVIWGRAYF